jgi:Tol biopolymer transport system component
LSPAGIDGIFEDYRAHQSPDGRYVVFLRVRNADATSAMFRTDATDRDDARPLTPWGLRADVFDLSAARRGPTANLIVFETYGRGDPAKTFVDLATVPATCPSLRQCIKQITWLTDNRASGRRNANPQWSPDGSSLVFTNRSGIDEPNADIWTMCYGQSQRRQISTSPNFDYGPDWGNLEDD